MENTSPDGIKKDASYGAVISIVIILAIIVVGAFYSWGKRVSEQPSQQPADTEQQTSSTTHG